MFSKPYLNKATIQSSCKAQELKTAGILAETSRTYLNLKKVRRRRRRSRKVKAMNFANSQLFSPIFLFLIIAVFSETSLRTLGQQIDLGSKGSQNGFGRRVLMSFKEKPPGSNVTFECSPSGPCVPCLYSEKGDEKYRCSETGYRIPLKCIESEDSVKDSTKTDSEEQRSLLDSSSTSNNRSQAYITYRSCIPASTEDKLSVLSFEGIVILMLLVSGSIIYLRKKKPVSVSGYAAVRS